MRIPVSKIYRAFPELDSFTDEQCERFMKRIELSKARKILTNAAFLLISGLGLAINFVVLDPLIGVIFDFDKLGTRRIATVLLVVIPIVLLILPFALGLIARDFCLRSYLQMVIQNKLGS